ELRKAQIDGPMELPRAVAKILEEAGPQTDELAKIPRGDIREQRGRRPLLSTETCQPESIDRVRLGPDQVLLGKAPSTQRLNEGNRKALRGEHREQILPVMPGRLHDD